jgi:protein-S-isoprenylcysteine O-methyltransferase Ste14
MYRKTDNQQQRNANQVNTMTKASAAARSAIFFLIAPGMVIGVLPWWISRWRFRGPSLGLGFLRYLGVVLLLIGVAGLVDSFAKFVLKGLGTPSPTMPTKSLVVDGLYRYVRNPMYLAIILALLGESLLFENYGILAFATGTWIVTHTFVVAYEEPVLQAKYGNDYSKFLAHVPRWIPRLTPWKPAKCK